jgi:hypothetical protein
MGQEPADRRGDLLLPEELVSLPVPPRQAGHRLEVHNLDVRIVLAGAGVAVGALLAGLITGDLRLSGQPDAVVGLAWFAGLLLLSGISVLAAAVYPRTGKPQQGYARYFREILQYKGDEAALRKAVEKESSDIGARDLQQVRVSPPQR